MKRIAIIDLGSNSIRMSIFDLSNPQKAVNEFRSTIRLGAGLTGDGRLSAEAQLRGIRSLLEYKKIALENGVEKIIAVATAAVRKAINKDEFLKLVTDAVGIELQVIDGNVEGALDSLAVSRRLDLNNGIICDIGGGSTELIGICDGASPIVSVPHGSGGICERFFGSGENPESIRQAEAFVLDILNAEGWLDDFQGGTLVGIGGTLRALAKFDLQDLGKAPINRHDIETPRLYEIIREIEGSDRSARINMAGIGEERADIIMGGVVILKAIIKRLSPSGMTVADIGVREGVLYDYIDGNGLLKNNE